jgi:hypothetical protein
MTVYSSCHVLTEVKIVRLKDVFVMLMALYLDSSQVK